MTGLDIFALIVLLVLVATFVGAFIFLGLWPGMIAKQRNHPQVDAITIGGWIGLLAGGVLWPLTLIWAYTNPIRNNQNFDQSHTDSFQAGNIETNKEAES
jgi:hypothetical protein